MTQPAQRLGLDLPYAFPRKVEFLTHLLKRITLFLIDPKMHFQDLFRRETCGYRHRDWQGGDV
jgi:hypothetical protein